MQEEHSNMDIKQEGPFLGNILIDRISNWPNIRPPEFRPPQEMYNEKWLMNVIIT